MNIPRPTKYSYTIYVRSNCVYCTKAKELLQNENRTTLIVNCDGYLAYNRQEFLNQMQAFIGHEYRTFPMIFKNGVFVGGYTEAKQAYGATSCSMC